MIKLAIIADLHLPENEEACQYATLRFAVKSIKENSPDAVVCLGDALCCGDMIAAERFLAAMEEIELPRLFVLGNSDIRTPETRDKVGILETAKELQLGGIRLIGLNSADEHLSAEDIELLYGADENTVVFMHHPPKDIKGEGATVLNKKRSEIKALVYGHLHETAVRGNMYSVQALDPDKAIGEPPCVTYMTVGGDSISLEYKHFPCERIEDIEEYIGLSCFDLDAIRYAADNGIKNIELRPDAVYMPRDELKTAIEYWRQSGGRYLSLHMPDFGHDGNDLTGVAAFKNAVELACELAVNGVTVHVPVVEVGRMSGDTEKTLTAFICERIKALPETCAVGIENMHMTAAELPDEHRRFGYTPEECVCFAESINKVFGFERVGILLDVGHARNNAPYSQKYSLGEWYAAVGSKTVAYHIHQVIIKDGKFENHTAVSSFFGPLISFCSLGYCWNNGLINKKPLFLEIRGGKENYAPSVRTFLDYKS